MTNQEIDALVAEKVMGWKRVDAQRRQGLCPELYELIGENETQTWNGIPHYSTDLSDAWELLERFPQYNIQYGYKDQETPVCRCDLYDREWKKHATAIEATVPLAICQAALKANDVVELTKRDAI